MIKYLQTAQKLTNIIANMITMHAISQAKQSCLQLFAKLHSFKTFLAHVWENHNCHTNFDVLLNFMNRLSLLSFGTKKSQNLWNVLNTTKSAKKNQNKKQKTFSQLNNKVEQLFTLF